MEFEFYLAEQLGMTVGQLRSELSNDEFVHWVMYYGRKSQRMELAHKQASGGR